MVWGSFGVIHLASLVLGAGLIIGLYYLLRPHSAKTQVLVLGILSFSGIAAVILIVLLYLCFVYARQLLRIKEKAK